MKETPIKYGVFVKVMCKKPVSFILWKIPLIFSVI
jgi:hypothetical protein